MTNKSMTEAYQKNTSSDDCIGSIHGNIDGSINSIVNRLRAPSFRKIVPLPENCRAFHGS